jgi:serralysin
VSALANKQTYLESGQQIKTKPFSGVLYVDALLNMGGEEGNGIPIRWVTDPYLTEEGLDKSITTISYSFPTGGPSGVPFSYPDDVGQIFPIAFSSKQQEDIREAFSEIEKYINVNFVEVIEDSDSVGTIRLAMNTITDEQGNYREGIAATADPVSARPRGGDVWFNKWFEYADFSTGLVAMAEGAGNIGSQTAIGDVTILYHEVFHALGVEHPNDNPDIPFPEEKNSREYTVMAGEFSGDGDASAYTINGKIFAIPSTPMAYDVAALQYLYGANATHNSGDTTYTFDPNTPEIKLIWDGGGTDTLDFTNFVTSSAINLVDGSYSTVPFNGWSLKNNISIAFGAVIENVIAGSGADSIVGNSSDNILTGGKGNDNLDGGVGIDMAVYTADLKDTVLTNFIDYGSRDGNIQLRTAWNVVLAGETDTLRNIERLKFNDTFVALDLDGNAGKIVKLLAALLGAASATEKAYVGAGLHALDNGMSYEALMKVGIDVVFGSNPAGSSVVDTLYQNLVGSAAPQSLLDEYGAMLDDGIMSATDLGIAVAEHSLTATNIDLVGLASSGLEYIL